MYTPFFKNFLRINFISYTRKKKQENGEKSPKLINFGKEIQTYSCIVQTCTVHVEQNSNK